MSDVLNGSNFIFIYYLYLSFNEMEMIPNLIALRDKLVDKSIQLFETVTLRGVITTRRAEVFHLSVWTNTIEPWF